MIYAEPRASVVSSFQPSSSSSSQCWKVDRKFCRVFVEHLIRRADISTSRIPPVNLTATHPLFVKSLMSLSRGASSRDCAGPTASALGEPGVTARRRGLGYGRSLRYSFGTKLPTTFR